MLKRLKFHGLMLLLIVGFALAGCVRVPKPAAPGFTQQERSATVPLQLVHTSDRAVLPLVAVQMREQTYWWLLDTGSSHNLIAQGLAESLQLRAVAASELASIGGRQRSTHYQLPKLVIGGLRLDKQSASAIDLSHLSAPGYTVSGILGAPALSRLQVLLDLPRRRMVLSDQLPLAVRQAAVATLPFQRRAGVPVINANIDGRQTEVIADTGNATALVMLPAFTRFSPQQAQSFSFIETRDLGGSIPARLARVSTLQLGNKLFRDIPVSLPLQNHRYQRAAVAGSLGNGLLRQQPVVFDFPGQQLLILGDGDALRPGQEVAGGFGFRLARSNRIEVVLPGSPAQRSGLQVGERIVAVDNQPTTNAYEIWPRLQQRQRVQLTVQGRQDLQLRRVILQRGRFLPVLQ